jgi:hypothetical protein
LTKDERMSDSVSGFMAAYRSWYFS